MALLQAENVTLRFRGIVALDEVSLAVGEGEIAGLIGPNGAGKTTLFNVITRLYQPDSGRVFFADENLLRARPHKVVRRGIARTFQNVVLFPTMTALENVVVGTHSRMGFFRGLRAHKTAREMIDDLGLGAVADRPAAGLPLGTAKRIELARALVSRPRLLLLDEPAGGLNHEEVVEHHMNLVMSICEQVHVLNFGRKIAAGPPAAVQANPDVIEAYLGTEAAA